MWVIILAIVVLVFGVGRIGRLGEELGKGVREFRKASEGQLDDDKPAKESAAADDADE